MNVIQFLQSREHGCSKRKSKASGGENLGTLVEDRTSTLTKNQACELSGLPRATFLMDFSPDGTKVASTHGDHTVRVTDITSGKCTHVLTGHPRTPWCVAFHPSSNEILASGCLGGEVRIWDLHGGGSEVWHSPTNGVIASLAFHPMDHVLVFATGNTVYFWDWSQPEPFAFSRTNYEFERIRWLRFDPLGHYLYTGIANNTTVHREEPANVLHINETNGPHPNRLQQYANRRRYQQVIQRFHDYQQERLRNANRGDEDGSMEVENSDGSQTSSSTESNSLLGRHYSSQVEQRLRRAGNYASSITETTRHARDIVSSISSRRRNNPYPLHELRRFTTLHSLQPGTWSPPPRVWPSVEEEDMDLRSGTPGATTPPQLSEMAEVGAQRPLLVRPTTSASALRPPLFPNEYSRGSSAMSVNSIRSSGGSNWMNLRRSGSSDSNPPTSGAGPRTLSFGANLRSGLRFEHLSSSSLRPVSGPNSIVSSPYVSSLNRLRSRPTGSAFREVPRTSRMTETNTTPSSYSSSHPPCAICRTLNPSIVNNNSQPVTTSSSSTTGHQTTWSLPTPMPTSTGLVIPRSRPSVASTSRLLNMMMFQQNRNSSESTADQTSQSSRNSSSRSQERTLTTDGTSQTSGTMELPECSDQGTDVIGLSEDARRPVNRAGIEDSPRDEDEAMAEQDSVMESVEGLVEETEPAAGAESAGEAAGHSDIGNVLEDSDQNNNPSHTTSSVLSRITQDLPTDGSRREDLTSLTIRLERQVTELDRRITALRERFTERLRALHQDRERILNLRGRISNQSSPEGVESVAPTVTSGQASQHVPLITITRPRDQGDFSHTPSAYSNSTPVRGSGQNTHLLEMFLRGDSQQSTVTQPPLPPPSVSSVRVTPSREDAYQEDRSWHALQQRHLHPHYSVSILDDTLNRPNDALHAAINRAIAGHGMNISGAFMGTGEPAVASNIIPQTHRIQRWDFTKCEIPDISQSKANIVVPHCKLHNDASCDISQDATFLATFVPSHRGFPDDNILAVFSLHPDSFAQCLFTKSFGPNAISVSMSPRNQCVMVGLAAKRLSWVFTSNQLVAQVYKLDKKSAGENSMRHVSDVFHPCDMDIRTHVSVNSARWLRGVGEGLVYGTNRGDLHICRHGVKKATLRASEEFPENSDNNNSGSGREGTSIRMNLMSMLGLPQSRTSSIATQTLTRGIRRTAGTQTDGANSEPSEDENE
ncbi:activating molecule in BECN1-regulated autophagy protein 1A-like isoform X1 [Haliotis rufescens]|uniref:activating molecule in BECN1-regulated autophagy protein 1A-like isoform X1 n=1 Tax=Haliotis rufescens TaxID=6454 RepID=UPI001EB05D87|nr:activating molecule in BECN1-regulated autophagy protein 1A-like isoform X1 [Haliotis rufescens]